MRLSEFCECLTSIRKILWLTVFRYRDTCTAAIACFLVALVSTYFTVEAANAVTEIAFTSRSSEAESSTRRFLVVMLVSIFLRCLPRILYTSLIQEVCRRKMVYYLEEFLRLDYPHFHSRMPGEMRYSIFLKSYASVMTSQLFVFEVPIVLGTTFFSSRRSQANVHGLMTAITILTPLLYLLCVISLIYKLLSYQNAFLAEQERLSARIYDKLLNYEIIKAFSLEEQKTSELDSYLLSQSNAQVKMGCFSAFYETFLYVVLLLPYILIVSVIFNSSIPITPNEMFRMSIIYTTMAVQLRRLGKDLKTLVLYLNQIQFAKVIMPESVKNCRSVTGFEREIEFRKVTLLHHDSAIVSDINLTIRRGEKVAVIGPNGSGKSTFVKSLLGFTKFNGQILVDGHPTDEIGWEAVRKLISYVPQDDYTSDDTVMNNLLLGRPGSSREYIESKARAFGAHETFASLENGYDTEVGARGNRLSGGQRQKLSLVRAGVRDGAIFILDEATASMDKQYEKEVVELLFSYLKEKTVVMIVHGKEYLKRFDRLILLKDGRVEDVGSYDEIRRRSPWFRGLIEDDRV